MSIIDFNDENGDKHLMKIRVVNDVTINETKQGYEYWYHTFRANVLLDGKEVHIPKYDILPYVNIIIYFDKKGRWKSIDGFEKVSEDIAKAYPSLKPAEMDKAIKNEWKDSIERIAGVYFNVGDMVSRTILSEVFMGRKYFYVTTTRVAGKTKCDDIMWHHEGTCVILDYSFDSDVDGSSDNKNEEGDSASATKTVNVKGRGLRVINPRTMLTYSYVSNNDISINADVPGKGIVEQHYKITTITVYDYANMAFSFELPASSFYPRNNYGMDRYVQDKYADVLDVVRTADAEIMDGGFSQYYYDEEGNDAASAPDAYEAIGAIDKADIFRRANGLFPDGVPPKDLKKRRKLLNDLEKHNPDVFDKLDDRYSLVDDEHYDPPKDLDTMIYEYSMKHPRNTFEVLWNFIKDIISLRLNYDLKDRSCCQSK